MPSITNNNYRIYCIFTIHVYWLELDFMSPLWNVGTHGRQTYVLNITLHYIEKNSLSKRNKFYNTSVPIFTANKAHRR